jgi:thymidylate kinase
MQNTSKNIKRGLFIVFEGNDRAGKSTQVEMLKNHFESQNENCVAMGFPGR